MKLFIRRGNKVFGPYPMSQIQELLKDGRLVENDLASEDKKTWKDLQKFLVTDKTEKAESKSTLPSSKKDELTTNEKNEDARLAEWLEDNVIERDATYDVSKILSNKSFEEIIELADLSNSSEDELLAWKSFYASITQWVEVSFEFQDLVRIADSFSSWCEGELFFDSSKYVRVGINNETEETEVTYWGIRNPSHLKLKLKEFVDVWNYGYVTEAEAFMLIPNEFGGERDDCTEIEIRLDNEEESEKIEAPVKDEDMQVKVRKKDKNKSPFRPSEITETFGFKPEDAIQTPSIHATEWAYLRQLSTPDKARIKWRRTGSKQYDFGIVDKYAIFDQNDRFIYVIYVNPYSSELSQRAPQGLIEFRPMKDIHEKLMNENPELKKQMDTIVNQVLARYSHKNIVTNKDLIVNFVWLAFLIIGGWYFFFKWL